MWWLLIPVVGAVVGAIVSSDDDSTSSRNTKSGSRESAEGAARQREQQRLLLAKQDEILAETRSGLEQLFSQHPGVVMRRTPGQWSSLTFDALQNCVADLDENHSSFFRLKKLLPDTQFAQTFSDRRDSLKALEQEISLLTALRQQLDGEEN